MQRLEISCVVRLIYTSLGAKGLNATFSYLTTQKMADKSGMNFVPDLKFVIQRSTLGGWEDGKGVSCFKPLPSILIEAYSNKTKEVFFV